MEYSRKVKKEIGNIEQNMTSTFKKNVRVTTSFKAFLLRLKTHVEEFDKVE
jgi:hypothetical protein